MARGVNGDQWYTIDEAEAIVVGKLGPDAQRYIAEGLKDGRIRAKADRQWVSNEINLNVAWRKRAEHEGDMLLDAEVRPAIWRQSTNWPRDLARWRWSQNRFVITRRMRTSAKGTPPDRTIIVGLYLLKQDVQKLCDRGKKNNGGGIVRYEKWAYLIHQFIDLERKGRITHESYPSKNHLIEAIWERVELLYDPEHKVKTIGDTTAGRVAGHLWDLLAATPDTQPDKDAT